MSLYDQPFIAAMAGLGRSMGDAAGSFMEGQQQGQAAHVAAAQKEEAHKREVAKSKASEALYFLQKGRFQEAEAVGREAQRLIGRSGPKLIGTYAEAQGDPQPAPIGERMMGRHLSYDAGRPDFANPANQAAIRTGVEAAAANLGTLPKPEAYNLGPGETRWMGTPGGAQTKVAEGAPKPTPTHEPRYDIDPVSGQVKPVVPGTTFGVKAPGEGLNPYQQMMMMSQYQDDVRRWQSEKLDFRMKKVAALVEQNTRKGPMGEKKPGAAQMLQFQQLADQEFEKTYPKPAPPAIPGSTMGPSQGFKPPSGGATGGTARWAPIVAKASETYGVPAELITAVMAQESGGNARARSPVGAQGLMQLMPGTAAGLGVTDAWDPEQNIMGGVKYLRAQYDKFGSWEKALAAYNAGPGAVQKYGGVPPYKETQGYVSRIRARANAAAGKKIVSLPTQVASFYERHGLTPGAADA